MDLNPLRWPSVSLKSFDLIRALEDSSYSKVISLKYVIRYIRGSIRSRRRRVPPERVQRRHGAPLWAFAAVPACLHRPTAL